MEGVDEVVQDSHPLIWRTATFLQVSGTLEPDPGFEKSLLLPEIRIIPELLCKFITLLLQEGTHLTLFPPLKTN